MSARIDITGLRFGRLTAIRPLHKNKFGYLIWLCHCECGNEITASSGDLKHYKHPTRSCGCLKQELFTTRTHGHKPNSGASGAYRSWLAMKARCLNPKAINFANYGGQGILPCDQWIYNFEVFYAEMGARPIGMTLDRIDNDLGYFKENCRWADKKTQANNRKSTASRRQLSP